MFFRQKPSSFSDADLIARFRETGNMTYASELFTRYTTMLYGVCLKYLKHRDDAQDAVMQIFEKLPGALQQHDIAHFKSWVYVTARNFCLMQIRSKKGKFTEDIDERFMESALLVHPESEPEWEGDLTKLANCIERLADEQRQCVRLFFLEERSYKEIATATGHDLNKVKSYIQNGKRNLKICMEQHG
jgi:RNA polymerase sigma-70 factor (ECF subfamily)